LNSFLRTEGASYTNVENATSIKRPANNEARLKLRAPLSAIVRFLANLFPPNKCPPERKKQTPLLGLDPGIRLDCCDLSDA
jgi:hypothetical protein